VRQTVIGLFIVVLFTLAVRQATAQDQIRDLVVKIHAVQQSPDLLRPWTRSSPQQVKGSGVVIDGRRILTNAHVVRYASQIYVQPNQSASHIPARIEAITAGMDLAILKLDDESFFDNRGSLPFAQELRARRINVYIPHRRHGTSVPGSFAHRVYRLLLPGDRPRIR
jgi:S1-C subfamily serine protease